MTHPTPDQADGHRRRRLTQLGFVIGAAVVIVVLAITLSAGGGDSKSGTGGAKVQGAAEVGEMLAGIPQKGAALGRPDAPVTLVEFADPQCPFCRQYALGAMPEVIDKYVRPGRLRMELRVLAFLGPDSVRAARAYVASGFQNRLWNVADLGYWNQGRENSGYVTDAWLRGILGAVPGLDVERVLRDARSQAVTDRLAADQKASVRYRVASTPSFVMGRTGGSLQKVADGAVTSQQIGQAVDALAPKGGT
jgi:protein-disulfide isomerase